ncbi:MAG: hypothetical protein RMA76_45160 [Deltaproteobacteria bacterium]|jgi:hypothetical protein
MRASPVALALLFACATPPPGGGSGPASRPAARRAAASTDPGEVRAVAATADTLGTQAPADRCARTRFPFKQPLAVGNDADFERYPPIVGFPIAFPRGANLDSPSGFFASTRDGVALATQMEVLSRYGEGPTACGAPVKFAYGFAVAEVPPTPRAFFLLEHRPGFDPPVAHRVDVADSKDAIVVTTGAARFALRKDWFNGLWQVGLRDGRGYRTVVPASAKADVGMLVLEGSATASPLHGKIHAIEVERAGPVVATILAKGTYARRGEPPTFRFTVRYHFYAGTAVLQMDHTYYHGAVIDIGATGAINRVRTDRVFYRMPLALGGAPVVTARAAERLHTVTPTGLVSVQQDKRSPARPNVVFAVRHDKQDLEVGTFADRPMLAVTGTAAYAVATIAHLGPRDPQALRYDPKTRALELDWQSEALFVGGARGVWSKAVLDFGAAGSTELSRRASQLQAHGERPLIAVPNPAYLNTTRAYAPLPATSLPASFAKLDEDIDRLHTNTTLYLREKRITGTQVWPDLPRRSCVVDNACRLSTEGYFGGGDCNYWDWSLAELEAFLRTGDPAFAHDFALPEALTMAETVSYRPDPYNEYKNNSFAGFSPCYGSGDDGETPWREGLNHRVGNCPGDYGYNKVHRLAYLLTADRRFLDFFEIGADTVVRLYTKKPKDRPPHWFELSAARQTSQYLESLLTAAEFARSGNVKNRERRDVALAWFDFMRTRALERGHTCNLQGSGFSNPKVKGDCQSAQQWMLPIFVDWVLRLYNLYDHAPARAWLLDFVRTSTRFTTELDGAGLPDYGARNGGDGWRTAYRCRANRKGIQDDSCEKITDWENGNYFYANGMLAYLNALALVREVDADDSTKLCRWLPGAYASALRAMDAGELNAYTWGKSPGQAYAFAQRAVANLMTCP